MWKTRHLTACGHHPRPRAEYGLGGPTGVASHGVGAGAGSRSARGSAVLVAGDCLAGRRRPREGGLGGLWKRWSPEMGVKCVAQSCRGRTRNTRGRGGGAEERRLARARPRSRGDGFIPSGGRSRAPSPLGRRPGRGWVRTSQPSPGRPFPGGVPGPERGL